MNVRIRLAKGKRRNVWPFFPDETILLAVAVLLLLTAALRCL